jgi:hypothetical protein
VKWVGAALAAVAISFGLPAAANAKSCSAGYTHAIIGGAQKCLRRGEYCAVGERKQYPRYGFVCEDVSGTYRLEPKD